MTYRVGTILKRDINHPFDQETILNRLIDGGKVQVMEDRGENVQVLIIENGELLADLEFLVSAALLAAPYFALDFLPPEPIQHPAMLGVALSDAELALSIMHTDGGADLVEAILLQRQAINELRKVIDARRAKK